VSVGVAWSRSELTAALGPTLGDKKSSSKCGLNEPGPRTPFTRPNPSCRRLPTLSDLRRSGSYTVPSALCVETTGRHHGVEGPPQTLPGILTVPPSAHAPRVNVTCVTPLGEEAAST
jgi:hypothetical protein